MALFLFYLTVALYTAAAACTVAYIRTGGDRSPSNARRLATLGLACHTLFLAWWGIRHGRLPAYATFEAMAALLWCAVVACFVLGLSFRARTFTPLMMPLVALAGLAIALLVRPDATASSTARGWWLPVHVAASLLGAADFVVAAAVAAMYLVQQRQLKRKAIGPLLDRMPSLETLDRLNYRAVALGMPLFTLALISGIVLAVAKGPGWWANWLVATSLLAWVVYAILLHVRLRGGVRGPKVAYLTVAGFVLVAAMVCGIAFLGDSLHTLSNRGAPPSASEVHRDAP